MCIYDVANNLGVLKRSWSDNELLVAFHTSSDEEPKLYTIITTGEMDTMISLLGQCNNYRSHITYHDIINMKLMHLQSIWYHTVIIMMYELEGALSS